MISVAKYLSKGVKEILFPHVCEICGHLLPNSYSFVCDACLNSKFEEPQFFSDYSTSGAILPEGVQSQFAMWKFDKGGYLQDLLHNLKYHQLSGVGVDLGMHLGKTLIEKTNLKKTDDWLLVPVPLHYKKEHKRGYNQARVISNGIQKTMGFELVKKGVVVRTKNTKTQTGFNLKKRNENISKAFNVIQLSEIKERDCILVDDVFTTGATTFELANSLIKAGSKKIMIVTVACA